MKFLTVTVLALSVLPGCALFSIPHTLESLKTQTADLRERYSSGEATLEEVEEHNDLLSAANSEIKGDLLTLMADLEKLSESAITIGKATGAAGAVTTFGAIALNLWRNSTRRKELLGMLVPDPKATAKV